VPLGYVTTLPAARNASTCAEASGVRIISRKSWPMVSTAAPKGCSSTYGTRFREGKLHIICVTDGFQFDR
jgi:hypothetical protein